MDDGSSVPTSDRLLRIADEWMRERETCASVTDPPDGRNCPADGSSHDRTKNNGLRNGRAARSRGATRYSRVISRIGARAWEKTRGHDARPCRIVSPDESGSRISSGLTPRHPSIQGNSRSSKSSVRRYRQNDTPSFITLPDCTSTTLGARISPNCRFCCEQLPNLKI
jgi:hypothetical protein